MELQSRHFSVLSLKCCYDDMVGGMALFSTHLFLQKSATNLLTTNLIRVGTESRGRMYFLQSVGGRVN